MEDSLFDILVPFLTFIFIIGSAIVKSAAEKKADHDKKQGSTTQSNRPTSQRSQTSQKVEPQRRQTRLERFNMENSELGNQKNQQLDKLKRDLSISTRASVSNRDSSSDLGKTLVSKTRKRTITKKEMGFEAYFTEKGLAGSVVMAEVLGKPRAKKPYHPRNR